MLFRRWWSTAAKATTQTTPSRPSSSHIKAKLEHFIETGEIQKLTPAQAAANLQRKNRRAAVMAAKNTLSPQKALILLRSKYDAVKLAKRSDVKPIDLDKLSPRDLEPDSDMAAQIFEGLVEIKRVTKRKIPPRLELHLLGVSPESILDPFKVTEATLKLLEKDQNPTRAMELCHLARGNAVVASNAVIQWCFEHGKVKWAMKALHDRKRWMIPTNEQTFVHYFDGLARSFEWGGLSRHMASGALHTYSRSKTRSVKVFNACLSLLMKDFSDNQITAIEFLDNNSKKVIYDCQTFTIFLNGRKKYIQDKVEEIKGISNISAVERTRRLFEAQAELIETAKNVYKKVIASAIPPVPPTKEEADANPELLAEYRKKIDKVFMDIDPVFASSFLSCFINNFAGTSVSPSAGSHYQYMLQGLEYLRIWCPEVESMLHFAKENDESKILEPSQDVKRRTEERVDEANVAERNLPSSHIEALEKDKVNPLVVFPPPAFSSNKTRAIFSDKKKRLVDFTRPKFSDINKLVMHQTWVNSGGKFGQKLPSSQHISLEKGLGINSFLIAHATDPIAKIGAIKEYYLAMWYVLTKWGGLYVSRTDLKKAVAEDVVCGALPKSQYPDLTRVKNKEGEFVVQECLMGDESVSSESDSEFTKLSLSSKMDLTPSHEPTVVDSMLVENFIYKIEENFPKRYVPVKFVVELLAAITSPASNLSQSLKPRDKTFDNVFSILKRDVYFYNDKNLHKGAVSNRRRKQADNTPKSSLTTEQLHDILDPLSVLMKCIMVTEARMYGLNKKRQALMSNKFVESYDALIKHIKRATWSDAPDNHANALEIHKKILGSGILFYTPEDIYDPRTRISNAASVGDSVRYVYGKLKDREDLDDKEKRLMLALKSFIQLESKSKDVEEKLRALQWRVYNACK